jgi:hypothetical protein
MKPVPGSGLISRAILYDIGPEWAINECNFIVMRFKDQKQHRRVAPRQTPYFCPCGDKSKQKRLLLAEGISFAGFL